MRPWEGIFDIIEEHEGFESPWYSRLMTVVTLVSLVPLCFEESNAILDAVEYVCVAAFIADYLLRWAAADKKLKRGLLSFAIYPFTPLALLDLLSILPTFVALNPAFRAVRLVRLFRALRAIRLLRYSPGFNALIGVLRRERQSLLIVLGMTVAYALVSAIVVYNVEPDSFSSFPQALYWAMLSLTSSDYGDLHPVSEAGGIIAMVSSLAGISTVALPSGIITAGLIEELTTATKEDADDADDRDECR